MRAVIVYRVDYVRKTRGPIGYILERRRTDRGDNYLGLLRRARKVYASTPEEALSIAIDGTEVRRAWGRPSAGPKGKRLPA